MIARLGIHSMSGILQVNPHAFLVVPRADVLPISQTDRTKITR